MKNFANPREIKAKQKAVSVAVETREDTASMISFLMGSLQLYLQSSLVIPPAD